MPSAPADAEVHFHKEKMNSSLKLMWRWSTGFSLCLLTIIQVFAGCASKSELAYEIVPPAKPIQVEILNPIDQAHEEISKAPTKFSLQYPAAQYSWDRARLFFDQYTSNSTFTAAGKGTVRLHNRSSAKDATIYEVEKRDIPSGMEFTLRCSARSGANADQSCRNLARFLRDGTWEAGI